jgi:CubicO group peptidase (beta-lactamase class C family)
MLVVLIGVLGIGCTGPSPGPQESLKAFTAHLDDRVPALLSRYQVPGASLALVHDGRLAWTGTYGITTRTDGQPMPPEAVYRVESISKSVTAWGVMRLVEAGRIDLDAPVQRYLPGGALSELGADAQCVTVRRLLSHHAGLPLGPIGPSVEYPPGSNPPSLDAYLRREVRLVREPGSAFEYSNVGFNVLEQMIEAVTGRDFADYMADTVVQPLGMERSRFGWSDTLQATMPSGHEHNGTPVAPYIYAVQASGGLVATAADLGRFVQAAMTGGSSVEPRVLQRESIRRLHTPQASTSGLYGLVSDAYGMGHFIETLPDGRRAVWHGGQGHGWMSHFHAVPAAGEGIVILTNSQRSWPLLGHVLADWARWSGTGSVQWSRILDAIRVLQALLGILAVGTGGGLLRLLTGLWHGRRRWDPFAPTDRGRRALQLALGLGAAAALIGWAIQPYDVFATLFPRTAPWAAAVVSAGAAVLVLFALMPPGNHERD